MPTAVHFDLPGMTRQEYDSLIEDLGLGKHAPSGGILHFSAPNPDGGWFILDIWESEQAFHAFAREVLIPTARRLGLTISRPKIFPVHNLFIPDVARLGDMARLPSPYR